MSNVSPNIDNRVISIVDCGQYDDFEMAMSFFFRQYDVVYQFAITEQYGFIFFWASEGSVRKIVIKDGDGEVEARYLPYPMKQAAATQFVWNWLEQVQYPPQPDHDGSNKKAWKIYNEAWGHVAGRHEASVAVKPVWGMIGK